MQHLINLCVFLALKCGDFGVKMEDGEVLNPSSIMIRNEENCIQVFGKC